MPFLNWDRWKKKTKQRQLQDRFAPLRVVPSVVLSPQPTCFVQFIIVCFPWNGTWEHLAEPVCTAVTLTSPRGGQLCSLFFAALFPLVGIDDRQFFLLTPWCAEALSPPSFPSMASISQREYQQLKALRVKFTKRPGTFYPYGVKRLDLAKPVVHVLLCNRTTRGHSCLAVCTGLLTPAGAKVIQQCGGSLSYKTVDDTYLPKAKALRNRDEGNETKVGAWHLSPS